MVRCGLILCLIFNLQLQAQNFIPNPSFEDTLTCPQYMGYPCPNTNLGSFDAIYYWTNPICTSSDIFHSCNTTGMGIPNNLIGYQYALTGEAMAGLYSQSGGSSGFKAAEYITSPLSSPLSSGEVYTVSFFAVCGAPHIQYTGSNGIGAFLSIGFPDTTGSKANFRLYSNAQINNPTINVISDTVNWILISDTMTAVGGENYITIGNFLPDTQWVGRAYFYIDDVKVELGNHLNVQENNADKKFSIFPNPANDILNISSMEKIEKFEIFNSICQSVQKGKPEQREIFISDLQPGLYYFTAYFKNTFSTFKFIKQYY